MRPPDGRQGRPTHRALRPRLLGDCALIRHDPDQARRHYLESLRSALPLGDVIEIGAAIQGTAMASADGGDAHRSLRLLAAVDALLESVGLWASTPFWDALLEHHVAAARTALGADADAVWQEGRAMPLEDAVRLAMAHET